MRLIEKAWFESKHWVWILLPLSIVFWCISTLRRMFYNVGVFATTEVSKPVIVVGNISVGGNGKTPLVIYLCDFLRQQGYYPGVLSRGYGGKAPTYPLKVEAEHSADVVGDEPLILRDRVNCPVVVDHVRARGAQYLIDNCKCNVIVCDDGLQHYALSRDIEIAVIDGKRRFGNGLLLPAGPLRESQTRLSQVDFVVVNGGKASQSEYLMSLEPGRLVNVKFASQTKSIAEVTAPIVATAAIGNPRRFFDTLLSVGVKLKQQLPFPDHHRYKSKDLPNEPVLMTEKDAVKCREFAHEDWWYLPVNASLSPEFKQGLLEKLKSNKIRKKK